MNDKIADISSLKDTLLDLAVRFGPRVLVAILILVAGAFVSRAVSRWLLRMLQRLELESPVRLLLARATWAACFLLFFIMALQNLGVELLPLIAGLGVAGAGVALATQGVLSNLVAGLSIIFSKPFRVGDIHRDRGRGGRGRDHHALQYDAAARGSLARGGPEPQDRGRDPA